jgi:DNA-directed RNA polymerase specialized sigma24 family protein
MNATTQTDAASIRLDALGSAPPANDRAASDVFTPCYRRLHAKLRANCARYVAPGDLDDLLQDVWLAASQRPAKLTGSDASVLSWLMGVAKRCAPSYSSSNLSPLDAILAWEAGDDLEGRALHEDVRELRIAAREKR